MQAARYNTEHFPRDSSRLRPASRKLPLSPSFHLCIGFGARFDFGHLAIGQQPTMSEAGSSTATAKRPAEDIAGLYASDNVTIAIPAGGTDGRPAAVKHMYADRVPSLGVAVAHSRRCRSSPAYQSPIRHHRRGPSTNKREVKVGGTAKRMIPEQGLKLGHRKP